MGVTSELRQMGFVAEMRRIAVTPHVVLNAARSGGSAIDSHTTCHESYAKSINARRGTREGVCLDLDEVFSEGVAVGRPVPVQAARHIKVSAVFGLHVISHNMIRLVDLLRPGDGSGMSSGSSRCVASRLRSESTNGVDRLKLDVPSS